MGILLFIVIIYAVIIAACCHAASARSVPRHYRSKGCRNMYDDMYDDLCDEIEDDFLESDFINNHINESLYGNEPDFTGDPYDMDPADMMYLSEDGDIMDDL